MFRQGATGVYQLVHTMGAVFYGDLYDDGVNHLTTTTNRGTTTYERMNDQEVKFRPIMYAYVFVNDFVIKFYICYD